MWEGLEVDKVMRCSGDVVKDEVAVKSGRTYCLYVDVAFVGKKVAVGQHVRVRFVVALTEILIDGWREKQ